MRYRLARSSSTHTHTRALSLIHRNADDTIAKIRTWRFNDLNVKDLIRIAVKPNSLKHVRAHAVHRTWRQRLGLTARARIG